ncbi:hypothetical protein V8D89_007673 [Ganoderma adspersum]
MSSESSTASLNVDIMHTIMSYATRNIVSNLMKTCRTMNSEGAKHLLKDGVSVGCDAELVSFIYFLMARRNVDDSLRRLSFFEKFSLHFDAPSPEIAGLLAEFFERIAPAALNFTSLEIHTTEALLTSYPPLGAAIAKLTTLEDLELSFGGEHCAELLRTLQSKLVTAIITFGDGEREDEEIPDRYRNPILLLQGSKSTLESLRTSFSVSSFYGPRYTNVTKLSLSYMDLPDIEDYIRAFPNLVSLSAFECSGYGDDSEAWEDRREISMLYQAHNETWRSLSYYWGSVLILWTFGLTCRIPSVELDFDDHELEAHRRPARSSCLLNEEFRSVLRVDDLQVLDLRVSFSSREDNALFVGYFLDALVDLVRATGSAPIFKLTLDWSFAAGLRRMARGEELPPMPFEVYLQDMDVDAYADTLFASAASLKELQVSVVGPKRCTRQAERRRT